MPAMISATPKCLVGSRFEPRALKVPCLFGSLPVLCMGATSSKPGGPPPSLVLASELNAAWALLAPGSAAAVLSSVIVDGVEPPRAAEYDLEDAQRSAIGERDWSGGGVDAADSHSEPPVSHRPPFPSPWQHPARRTSTRCSALASRMRATTSTSQSRALSRASPRRSPRRLTTSSRSS